MKRLALFDFDQTLILENSLAVLLKGASGYRRLWPLLVPELCRGRLFHRDYRTHIKQRLYTRCLKNTNEHQLIEIGRRNSDLFHVNQPVVDRLLQFADQGVENWVVTASPRPFIQGLVESFGWPVARVIGTELMENRPGNYVGYYQQECSHQHKEERLEKIFAEDGIDAQVVAAFGNLPPDRELLRMAQSGYAVKGSSIKLFHLG